MSAEASHNDDELISAVLDGVATEAEAAQVSTDPRLRRRLEHLTRVRDLVAEAVEGPDELARRRSVELALASQVDSVAGVEKGATGSRWLMSAAVVLLVAVAVPLIAMLAHRTSGVDETATVADRSEQAERSEALSSGPAAASGATDEEEAAASADDEARDRVHPSAETSSEHFLGVFPDVESVVAAARKRVERPASEGGFGLTDSTQDPDSLVSGCPLPPVEASGEHLVVHEAVVGESPVLVVLTLRDEDDVGVQIFDLLSCEPRYP